MVDREPVVSEEELHAYVDGQIAGGECAVIERWLASHPEDAARVAAWRARRMRSAPAMAQLRASRCRGVSIWSG